MKESYELSWVENVLPHWNSEMHLIIDFNSEKDEIGGNAFEIKSEVTQYAQDNTETLVYRVESSNPQVKDESNSFMQTI